MKRRARVIIAIVALLALCACSKPATPVGTLIVAIPASPQTFDPRLATDAESDKIAQLVCEGLFMRNDRLEVVPALADRFETISDTSYRIYLKPGLVFSDGSPLSADDVAFTLKSVTEGKIASPLKSSYSMIKDVVAESPEVVRIDLTEPFAPLLSTLTIGIVSKTAATKSGDAFGSAPVCAGPYTVAKYVPDSAVWLSVNPRYYGKAPKVKELRFEVIKDENIRVMKLMKGDIDLVQNAIPPMLIDSVMKSPNLKMEADTGIVVSYLGFNLTDPILAKQKVREAIALAIDRDAVIAHRWKGLAEKANSILAPGNWAYDEGLLQYAYDPAKAAMLLDEAGFPDPDGPGPAMRFWLTWKTSTSKERIDIARMIADQLAKVGIGVKVRPYEWGTFYSGVRKGNFQMYSLSWVGAMEPDIFYNTCHSSQMPPAGLNRNRYKNSEIDALVEEGRRTMDEGKRREIYAKVQKILLDDLPFVPLWYEKNVIVYRKGLSGVHPRPDASYRSFMEIEKE